MGRGQAMSDLIHDRNAWLFSTFAIYVAFLFLFALVYQLIYRMRTGSFSFNGDIYRSQDRSYRAMKAQEAEHLTPIVSALTLMQEELSKGPAGFVREGHSASTLASQSGYEARLVARIIIGGAPTGAGTRAWRELTIQDPSGAALILGEDVGEKYALPKNASDFQTTLNKMSADFRQTITDDLNVVSAPTASPAMWSYWDFLYFSTITQSTVGYGDILPNSTTVRMVVVAQIVVGYALLVVILNLVFAGGWAT
jgi:hypothetical protein